MTDAEKKGRIAALTIAGGGLVLFTWWALWKKKTSYVEQFEIDKAENVFAALGETGGGDVAEVVELPQAPEISLVEETDYFTQILEAS